MLGHEPSNFFAGNVAQLLDLYREVARGLREGNPQVELGIYNNPHLFNARMERGDPRCRHD